MPAPNFESFSIYDAAILDGKTNASGADLYGVRSGTIDLDFDSYNNVGNDTILSVWSWFNQATITIESGFIPFDALSLLTGTTIFSSGTAPNDFWSMSLWSQSSLNQPTRPLVLRTAARKSDGSVGIIEFLFYKVQFNPVKFDGLSYKNGLTVSLSGQALMSDVDELGRTLPDPSVGRLSYTGREITVSALNVVNNGNGTYTVKGSQLNNNNDGTYTVNSSRVTNNGDGTYSITY